MAEKSPEQRKQYQVVKAFKALNTKANRTAIADEEFSWIENIQPIGFGNLKVVPQVANVTISGNTVTWSSSVSTLTSWNVNNQDYVFAFEADGSAQYYNITSGTQGIVAAAGTFSSSGVRVRQWKNDRIIISDPSKGYSTWDATNLVVPYYAAHIAKYKEQSYGEAELFKNQYLSKVQNVLSSTFTRRMPDPYSRPY